MNALTWMDKLQIVQTIAIIAALCLTIWQIRTQIREQRYRYYFDAISRSVDLHRLMVENRDLHTLYIYSDEDWNKSDYSELTDEQRVLVHYCDLMIAGYESVWLAAEDGWVPRDEWPYWKREAHQLNGSPAFRWALDWVRDDYNEEFLAELRRNNRPIG